MTLAPAAPGLSSTHSGPASGAVHYRKLCEEHVRRRYPGLEPRNDFDLVQLASEFYKGTHAEIFAALDDDLADTSEAYGYEVMMENSTKLLENYFEPTGVRL